MPRQDGQWLRVPCVRVPKVDRPLQAARGELLCRARPRERVDAALDGRVRVVALAEHARRRAAQRYHARADGVAEAILTPTTVAVMPFKVRVRPIIRDVAPLVYHAGVADVIVSVTLHEVGLFAAGRGSAVRGAAWFCPTVLVGPAGPVLEIAPLFAKFVSVLS